MQCEFHINLLPCRVGSTPGCALWGPSQVSLCTDRRAGERTSTHMESNELLQTSPSKARILVLHTCGQVSHRWVCKYHWHQI